jgi:hypothetical protein
MDYWWWIRTLDNQLAGSTSGEAAQNAAAGSGPEGVTSVARNNPSLSAIHRKRGNAPLFLWIIWWWIRTLDNQLAGSTSGEAVQNAAAGSGPEGVTSVARNNPSLSAIQPGFLPASQ